MPAVEKGPIFNTGPYGVPPLKIKIMKSGFLHARKDQKIGTEPKFYAPRQIRFMFSIDFNLDNDNIVSF